MKLLTAASRMRISNLYSMSTILSENPSSSLGTLNQRIIACVAVVFALLMLGIYCCRQKFIASQDIEQDENPLQLASNLERQQVDQLRQESQAQILDIARFLKFDALLDTILEPIKQADDLKALTQALERSKRLLAIELKALYHLEKDFIDWNSAFKSIDKPSGWDDLLDLMLLFMELDCLPRVETQDDVNQAFALGGLLKRCINKQFFSEIYRIADSHTRGLGRSWIFYYAIQLISNFDKISAHPERMQLAIDYCQQITDPHYRSNAEGLIAQGYFALDQFDQAYLWLEKMEKQDLKPIFLDQSSNHYFYHHPDVKKCLKLLAALRDVEMNLPLGTSTFEESVDHASDEKKEPLKKFLKELT